ncbi:hypothetical protein DL766_009000 [Monosporascus sp. MC13-8B]|nr:hypothetical protein DL763_001525 [Monosporascus cannonballus]RYP16936.1 hypothetical protein DL766_009000 [Monosporascus sp. MC13-8B]
MYQERRTGFQSALFEYYDLVECALKQDLITTLFASTVAERGRAEAEAKKRASRSQLPINHTYHCTITVRVRRIADELVVPRTPVPLGPSHLKNRAELWEPWVVNQVQ